MAVISPYNRAKLVVAGNWTSTPFPVKLGGAAAPARTLFKASGGRLLAIVNRGSLGDTGQVRLTLWTSNDAGSTWSFHSQLDSDTSSTPYIASGFMDGSDHVYIVWSRYTRPVAGTGHDMKMVKMAWNGGTSTWDLGTVRTVVTSSTTAVPWQANIVKDADGDLFIVCNFYDGTNQNIYSYYSTDDGANWSSSIAGMITNETRPDVMPALIATDGKVIAVWWMNSGALNWRYRNDADAQTTWAGGNTELIAAATQYFSLCKDSDGNGHLVYGDADIIKYRKYTASSDTWDGSDTNIITIAGGSNNTKAEHGISIGANGNDLYLAYGWRIPNIGGFGGDFKKLTLLKKPSGGSWSTTHLITPEQGIADEMEKVLVYDSAAAKYYDRTWEAASTTTGDVTSPVSGKTLNVVGDIVYLGFKNLHPEAARHHIIGYLTSTAASGGAVEVEYWNGSAWTAFSGSSNTPFTSSDSQFARYKTTDNGYPQDWATNAVNGQTMYWMRVRVTTNYTTAPVVSQIYAHRMYTYVKIPANFSGDVPIIAYEDINSTGLARQWVVFSSHTTADTNYSVAAGQIDIQKINWGEWSDTCTVTPSISTEAQSTTAGQIITEKIQVSTTAGIINLEGIGRATTAGKLDLEGIGKGTTAGQLILESLSRSTTAGQIITEGVPKATTAGLITLETVQKHATAGLIDLIGIEKSTTAGQIVLEGVPKSTTAGLITLETTDQESTSAGFIDTEGLGRNTTAGQIDMQKTTDQSAGLIDLEYADFRSDTAGRIDLEGIARMTSAGLLTLEAVPKSVTAGLINLEAHKLSTTAGLINIEATVTSRTAGLINIEDVEKSVTAGLLKLEAHKRSTTAGQIDMVAMKFGVTAGLIVLEKLARSSSAGMIDVAERVSGHLQAKVDKIPVIGYAENRPSIAKVTPTSPTGNVSPSKPSASVLTQKPKGYR